MQSACMCEVRKAVAGLLEVARSNGQLPVPRTDTADGCPCCKRTLPAARSSPISRQRPSTGGESSGALAVRLSALPCLTGHDPADWCVWLVVGSQMHAPWLRGEVATLASKQLFMAMSPPAGHSLAGPASESVGTGIASDVLLRANCVLSVLRGAIECVWESTPPLSASSGDSTDQLHREAEQHSRHKAACNVVLTQRLIRATVLQSPCWLVLVPEAVATKADLVPSSSTRHSKL